MQELVWNPETDEILTLTDLETVINHEEILVDEYFFDVDYSVEDIAV